MSIFKDWIRRCNSKLCLSLIVILCTFGNLHIVTGQTEEDCNFSEASDLHKISDCITYRINQIDYEEEFEKVKDSIDIDDTIRDFLETLDVNDLLQDTIGISLGGLIVLIIFILSLPSLIIIGSIFLCCWGFKCCCFSKKYQHLRETQPIVLQNQVVNSSPFKPLNETPTAYATPVGAPMLPRFNTKYVAPEQPSNSTSFDPPAGRGGVRVNPPNSGGGYPNPGHQQGPREPWKDY